MVESNWLVAATESQMHLYFSRHRAFIGTPAHGRHVLSACVESASWMPAATYADIQVPLRPPISNVDAEMKFCMLKLQQTLGLADLSEDPHLQTASHLYLS